MTTDATLRLATRGSDLARRQAGLVRESLEGRRRTVTLTEVTTRGDELADELIHRLGKTGAFVRSLDEKVLSGAVDAAVHSMKDMPTEMPDELVVAGVPERAPAGDVLVTPDGATIDQLPPGAVVGTSSLRRTAQLKAARPDLQVEPLRGNVDTRVQKLLAPTLQREHERRLESDAEGGDEESIDESAAEWFDALSELEREALGRAVDTTFDAIVLAEAGLRRSGLFERVETVRLDRSEFVPAPGQGALAVTAADPDVIETIRTAIDHPRTRIETTVERTVLSELGGGCIAPIGVNAMLRGEYVHTRVRVLSGDGTEAVAATRDIDVRNHAEEAAAFAGDLREEGAATLIDAAKSAMEDGAE
ncbi:MAG: hydroxymethylbilane synthase [Halobacteriota archaeon]